MQEINQIRSVTGHLLAAVRRAFGRVFLTFLGFGVVGGGAVEGANFFTNGHHLTPVGNVAAIVFGLVLAYAAGLTVAVVEAVRALNEAIKEVVAEGQKAEKAALGEVEKLAGGTEGVAGGLIKTVEGGLQNLGHKSGQ